MRRLTWRDSDPDYLDYLANKADDDLKELKIERRVEQMEADKARSKHRQGGDNVQNNE